MQNSERLKFNKKKNYSLEAKLFLKTQDDLKKLCRTKSFFNLKHRRRKKNMPNA